MNLCYSCGKEIEKDVRFCTLCGAALLPSVNSVPSVVEPHPQQFTPQIGSVAKGDVYDDIAADLAIPVPPPQRPSSRMLPVLVGGIAVLIFLIAAFFLIGGKNVPPTIEPIEISQRVVNQGQNVTLTARANDPDGDSLFYRWNTTGGILVGNGASVTLDTSNFDPGSMQSELKVNLIVSDGRGGDASTESVITVLPSDPVPAGSPQVTPPGAMTIMLAVDRASITAGDVANLTAQVSGRDPGQLSYEWKTSAGSVKESGQTASLQTSSNDLSGNSQKALVTVTVKDVDGQTQSASRTITIVSPKPSNWPPTVQLRASKTSASQGEELEFYAEGADRDGDTLTYSWNTSQGQLLGAGSTANNRVKLRTSSIVPGQAEIKVTVSDSRGESATESLFITVLAPPNRPPAIAYLDTEKKRVRLGDRVMFAANASDPDNDALAYAWSSTAGTIRANGSTATLDTSNINTEPDSLQVIVAVTVTDARGGRDYRSASVTVVPEIKAPDRPIPLSVSSYQEDDAAIFVITGRPGSSSNTHGSITVTVSPSGGATAFGMLPPALANWSYGGFENLSKDRIAIKSPPLPSNGYSRMEVRIRSKNSGKPIRFTLNWQLR